MDQAGVVQWNWHPHRGRMEEPDSETPTPVIEKISTDLNRIAIVLEGWATFPGNLLKAALYVSMILFLLHAGIAIIQGNNVSAGTRCTVAKLNVFGVADLQVRTELENATKINDEIGVQELISRGRVFPLPRETKCLVLNSTFSDSFATDLFDFSFYRKIRILSDDYYGKAVWVPNAVLQIAAGTDLVARSATLGQMLGAFVDAKRYFSNLHPDYQDSLMGPYQPGTVTKLGEGQYRVVLKYDSKRIQCEVDQSVARCSQ
jgi:hypothetical protein